MSSTKSKFTAAITLMAFVLVSGCAGMQWPSLMPANSALPPVVPPALPLVSVTVKTVPERPLNKTVIRKGQIAALDGIFFDKESAKRILADLAELKELRIKVQIQEQLMAVYEQQRQLLKESNDLMAASNELYRKEIESQRKWNTVKMVLSVVSTIAGFILGFVLAK